MAIRPVPQAPGLPVDHGASNFLCEVHLTVLHAFLHLDTRLHAHAEAVPFHPSKTPQTARPSYLFYICFYSQKAAKRRKTSPYALKEINSSFA